MTEYENMVEQLRTVLSDQAAETIKSMRRTIEQVSRARDSSQEYCKELIKRNEWQTKQLNILAKEQLALNGRIDNLRDINEKLVEEASVLRMKDAARDQKLIDAADELHKIGLLLHSGMAPRHEEEIPNDD